MMTVAKFSSVGFSGWRLLLGGLAQISSCGGMAVGLGEHFGGR